jgi:hypothetical protein
MVVVYSIVDVDEYSALIVDVDEAGSSALITKVSKSHITCFSEVKKM